MERYDSEYPCCSEFEVTEHVYDESEYSRCSDSKVMEYVL